MARKPNAPLRRGFSTGACATAAVRAAYQGLLTGSFPDPVQIRLPHGEAPLFALARKRLGRGFAEAGIVKDAGDDPDVTHGALVTAKVRRGSVGSGVSFRAGEGVGIVTKPGLPLAVGEPAINPVPRAMMRQAITEAARDHGASGDAIIEIGVANGAALAEKTWNPRLGIQGGLSILGTTGIVVPYSCAAWISSIHRGIDVARAANCGHVAGCTGKTSEVLVRRLYGLPEVAFLDMGDFAGGLLKYLRRHPLPKLTIAGGFAKMTKFAAGHLDLHSGRSQVDIAWLVARLAELGATPTMIATAGRAPTAFGVLEAARQAGVPLADVIAAKARGTANETLRGAEIAVEVLVVDRQGRLIGQSG